MATVKNGKIYILYRAEDKSGIGIGFRTSRLGLAVSADGIKVKRSPVPVLYPANDRQKEFEWTGGREDPRVAMTANGTYVVFYTQWNHDLPRLGLKKAGNTLRVSYLWRGWCILTGNGFFTMAVPIHE